MDVKERVARLRRIAWGWSVGYLGLLVGLYVFRSDGTFALTVWPAWVWAGFGLLLTLVANRWRPWIAVGWVMFLFAFVDEATSFPRALLPSQKADFVVVTLNCAGGTVAAAREVAARKPDLVLLQESPSSTEVRALAKEWFGDEGSYVSGPDASIVARGRLVQVGADLRQSNAVAAIWTSSSGRSLQVVSLRLRPPVMRMDLYDPAAWAEFAENRKGRRGEVEELAANLAKIGFTPDLVGGDFNTPPDREVQWSLLGKLSDSFAKVGVGYGATCVNPYPCIVRIDQIWSGARLEATRSEVCATENSDHRMLVVGMRWAEQDWRLGGS